MTLLIVEFGAAACRLMEESLERCVELLEGKPLTVLSKDPRLVSQENNVSLGGFSVASGRYVL